MVNIVQSKKLVMWDKNGSKPYKIIKEPSHKKGTNEMF